MTSKELQRQSRVVWFEIPTDDFDRAVAFYGALFQTELKKEQFGGSQLAVFRYPEGSIGGCVISGPEYRPAPDGPVIYLNADPSLDAVLARVPEAGGSIAQPATRLPGDMGVYAHIIDTEGNRVGLHAMS